MHRLTWYRERFPDQPPLPVAERAGDEMLSLPLSPAHSDDDIADVIEALAPRPRDSRRMKRGVRVVATLVVTGLAIAYLVWKIDIRADRRHPRRREPVVVPARGRDHGR